MEELKNEESKETEQATQAEQSIETAEQQATRLEAALKDSEDRHLRLLAEYDNYRKRSKKEMDSAFGSGYTQGIATLLPVVDNISRAVTQDCADDSYKKGIVLIEKQIAELFEKHNIEQIGVVGEIFDPLLHNAVLHVDDDTLAENMICEVFQTGYKMKDRVIRIATVKVAN